MARFYPLYIRRSDGKAEIIIRGKRKEPNQPTDDQLDQRPDKDGVSDFYREVSVDEPKNLDWRRKLGGMLAREMDWKDKSGSGTFLTPPGGWQCDRLTHIVSDSGYMLMTFPENYRLYEHVKKTEKDGKLEVKNKTHAAGGNDRQDAYLYGHPMGRRKRFRSPGDFFPHLLWLCTDESGDPDNCTCKICSPEDLENIMPGAKVKPEKAIKQDSEPKPALSQPATTILRPSSTQDKVQSEQATPGRQSNSPLPRPLVPTPYPQFKTHDQYLDSQYRTFMYRPGELVWFKRGHAWGLGVVLRRWTAPSNQYHYSIQPLSHPFQHPAKVMKVSDGEMRPWLAWSVPRFTNEGLNNIQDPLWYDNADWSGMMQRRYGTGDLEVDGSILAAKTIDASYTPFGLLHTNEPEPGLYETYYNGIFLGPEKVWVGDPVRLHIGSGSDIMVVHSVLERKRVSTMNRQIVQQSIQLIGDVYTLASVHHNNPNIPTLASQNNNPQLPQRLTEDLAYRNARTIPAKFQASYWRLASIQSRIGLNDIKGRWYEASRLLPILQLEAFEDAARKGEIPEASLWMNGRGDCLNSNRSPTQPRLQRENFRKDTRLEALGRAVPPNTDIREGVEPPMPENVDLTLDQQDPSNEMSLQIDPRFETAEDVVDMHTIEQSTQVETDDGLDEFMNLEGIEDHSQMPGFGQNYGNRPSDSGYYY